jgi:hypothetical protein
MQCCRSMHCACSLQRACHCIDTSNALRQICELSSQSPYAALPDFQPGGPVAAAASAPVACAKAADVIAYLDTAKADEVLRPDMVSRVKCMHLCWALLASARMVSCVMYMPAMVSQVVRFTTVTDGQMVKAHCGRVVDVDVASGVVGVALYGVRQEMPMKKVWGHFNDEAALQVLADCGSNVAAAQRRLQEPGFQYQPDMHATSGEMLAVVELHLAATKSHRAKIDEDRLNMAYLHR